MRNKRGDIINQCHTSNLIKYDSRSETGPLALQSSSGVNLGTHIEKKINSIMIWVEICIITYVKLIKKFWKRKQLIT